MKKTIVAALLAVAAAGCSGGNDFPPPHSPVVDAARAKFPTALALHTQVIARSCTPTEGVCHNQKEYPDMHTVGNFQMIAGHPCNEDKVGTPAMYWNGCEPKADELEIPSLDFRTRIAWFGPDTYQGDIGVEYRELDLEKPIPGAASYDGGGVILRDGEPLVTLTAGLSFALGAKQGRLDNPYNDVAYTDYAMLAEVQGGDPNLDGVFGADHPWQEVMPGHSDRSYLIGRITAQVPGSRMPLANQSLSDPEYVAIFCWIETAAGNPSPDAKIDYDHCEFARNPVSYAIGN